MTKRSGQKGRPATMILNVQVPTEVVDALDREMARLREAQPGARVTRSDAIRTLLLDAIKRRESESKKSS